MCSVFNGHFFVSFYLVSVDPLLPFRAYISSAKYPMHFYQNPRSGIIVTPDLIGLESQSSEE
ncbi:hypothetical protein HA38_03375 [Pantoea allii]|nr:hypothetical protein HA38_03375 [Pantoea allii]PBK00059.1 hypothetical protein CMR03_12950 [Pantoea allii]PBK00229.1 hypothetical protein CMR03_11710 [Pantoea allii]